MTETQDWNSGQGAYPRDLDTWELTMVGLTSDERVVRHLSNHPALDEIRSLCDDEMGDTEAEVTVTWYLVDPHGNYADGRMTLNPTGGAA